MPEAAETTPGAPAPERLHIASLVVHSTPKRASGVAELAAALPGAQVHAISPKGKLVVTLEAADSDTVMAHVGTLQRTDGVLSVAMVYECSDTLESMNSLITLEDAPHAERHDCTT